MVVAILAALVLVPVLWKGKKTAYLSYREMTAQWRAVFFNRDAATAYAIFLRSAATVPSDEAHSYAHLGGRLLYERYGLNGVRFCTDDFNFACYHGFASLVIEGQGPSEIPSLLDACGAHGLLNCQHGVGHGLVAYMGNDHLNDALKFCPTQRSGPCTTGIFMEYFLNTMTDSEDRRILSFDPHDPTAPCAVVTESQYMAACHYNLPKLWRYFISQQTPDQTERYIHIGKYCEMIPNRDYRSACFAGTGALAAAFANFDEATTMALCDGMAPDGRDACKADALRAIELQHKWVPSV